MNAVDYYNKYLSSFSASAFVGMEPQEPKVLTNEEIHSIVVLIRIHNEKQENKYLPTFKHLIDKPEEEIQKSLFLRIAIMMSVFDGKSDTNNLEAVGLADKRGHLLDSLYTLHHCETLKDKISQQFGEIVLRAQKASTDVTPLEDLVKGPLEGEQLARAFDSILLLSEIINHRKEFIRLAEIRHKVDLLFGLASVYSNGYFKEFTRLNGVRIFNTLKPYLDTTLSGNSDIVLYYDNQTTGVTTFDMSKRSDIAADNTPAEDIKLHADRSAPSSIHTPDGSSTPRVVSTANTTTTTAVVNAQNFNQPTST